MDPKLYSYVVACDDGFAPNPSGNYCTLACCKDAIRKSAHIGDWVVGTGSKNKVGPDKLVYAMNITEKITFEQYYEDRRFKGRRDNIYYKNKEGKWIQESRADPYHNPAEMTRDLRGQYVLISDHFFYFGKKAIPIPEEFNEMVKRGHGGRPGPGCKCNFGVEFVERFVKWIEDSYDSGKHGEPYGHPITHSCGSVGSDSMRCV